jgi:hypothetical protein
MATAAVPRVAFEATLDDMVDTNLGLAARTKT